MWHFSGVFEMAEPCELAVWISFSLSSVNPARTMQFHKTQTKQSGFDTKTFQGKNIFEVIVFESGSSRLFVQEFGFSFYLHSAK